MNGINITTVIASIIVSAITAQIVFIINSKFLNKKLQKFQEDTIESCTDSVADYINHNVK